MYLFSNLELEPNETDPFRSQKQAIFFICDLSKFRLDVMQRNL